MHMYLIYSKNLINEEKSSLFTYRSEVWATRIYCERNRCNGYLYPCSKNDVISSVRKHYCAFGLGLGLGIAEIRFRSNVFPSKCNRSDAMYLSESRKINYSLVNNSSVHKCWKIFVLEFTFSKVLFRFYS